MRPRGDADIRFMDKSGRALICRFAELTRK
jgi:hypothetical protein